MRQFVQVDKIHAVFFDDFVLFLFPFLSSFLSSKTDTGSAGEQPVRDSLMTEIIAASTLSGGFYFGPYALKNSSINFFLRSIESPL